MWKVQFWAGQASPRPGHRAGRGSFLPSEARMSPFSSPRPAWTSLSYGSMMDFHLAASVSGGRIYSLSEGILFSLFWFDGKLQGWGQTFPKKAAKSALMNWTYSNTNHYCAAFTKHTRGERCVLDDLWPGSSPESPCPSCGSRCTWEFRTRCCPEPWWSCARGSSGPAGRSSSRTLPPSSAWTETRLTFQAVAFIQTTTGGWLSSSKTKGGLQVAPRQQCMAWKFPRFLE